MCRWPKTRLDDVASGCASTAQLKVSSVITLIVNSLYRVLY